MKVLKVLGIALGIILSPILLIIAIFFSVLSDYSGLD